MQFNR